MHYIYGVIRNLAFKINILKVMYNGGIVTSVSLLTCAQQYIHNASKCLFLTLISYGEENKNKFRNMCSTKNLELITVC